MTQVQQKNIPIFFSCDDNYIPYLTVTLESIKAHAKECNFYTIKVLHANSVSRENQKRVTTRYSKNNMYIEFVDITHYVERINKELHTRDYYSKSTYYRLFIPNLYPEYDKVLYLDSDIVLLDDVANLYNVNLGDNFVGAISDESVSKVPEFIVYVKNKIYLESASRYFNAGILLMNLKKLCEVDFETTFLEMIKAVKFDVAQDQDYLNVICAGRVKYIDAVWNKMPLPDGKIKEKDIKLIHYNLSFKPWKTDGVLYEKHFWTYAKRSPFYKFILESKRKAQAEISANAEQETVDLKSACVSQAMDTETNAKNKIVIDEILGNMRKREEESQKTIKKAPDRIEALERISELERQGLFDQDVELDPPSKELLPNKVDYLNKKLSHKFYSFLAYLLAARMLRRLKRDKVLNIKAFEGIENFQNLKSGAIITCNHFNALDSFAMEECYFRAKQKGRKLYRVIKEGNYTNFPGAYGFLMRHCNTLPLSSNPRTMRMFLSAVDTILQRGDFILIYPEQSMWWNYRKPKPLKKSAFKFAVKNNVPVLPIFVTMEDSDRIGEDGFPMQDYTMHICEPIYAEEGKTMAENVEMMKSKNFEMWKDVYEKTYKMTLTYTTEVEAVEDVIKERRESIKSAEELSRQSSSDKEDLTAISKDETLVN